MDYHKSEFAEQMEISLISMVEKHIAAAIHYIVKRYVDAGQEKNAPMTSKSGNTTLTQMRRLQRFCADTHDQLASNYYEQGALMVYPVNNSFQQITFAQQRQAPLNRVASRVKIY